MLPTDPTFSLRRGRQNRAGVFNQRPRSGTLAGEAGSSGRKCPPCPEAFRKDLAEQKVFVGYKGGDYPFHRDRVLWVANHGETSNTIITGLAVTKYDERAGVARILTEQEDD